MELGPKMNQDVDVSLFHVLYQPKFYFALQVLLRVVTWTPLSMETWTNQGILLEQFPPTLAMVVTCWLETTQGPVRTMDSGPATNQSVNVSQFSCSSISKLSFQLL